MVRRLAESLFALILDSACIVVDLPRTAHGFRMISSSFSAENEIGL